MAFRLVAAHPGPAGSGLPPAGARSFLCGGTEAPGHIGGSRIDRSVDHIGIHQRPVFPHAQNSGAVPDLIAGACIGGDVAEGDVKTSSGCTRRGVETHTLEDHGLGAATEGLNVVGVGGALFNAALERSGESELLGGQSTVRHLVRGVDYSLAGGADDEDGIVLRGKSGCQAAIEGINNDPWKVRYRNLIYLRYVICSSHTLHEACRLVSESLDPRSAPGNAAARPSPDGHAARLRDRP